MAGLGVKGLINHNVILVLFLDTMILFSALPTILSHNILQAARQMILVRFQCTIKLLEVQSTTVQISLKGVH